MYECQKIISEFKQISTELRKEKELINYIHKLIKSNLCNKIFQSSLVYYQKKITIYQKYKISKYIKGITNPFIKNYD